MNNTPTPSSSDTTRKAGVSFITKRNLLAIVGYRGQSRQFFSLINQLFTREENRKGRWKGGLIV